MIGRGVDKEVDPSVTLRIFIMRQKATTII